MPEIRADRQLVARCGLYCGACGSFLEGRCPGCVGNEKASWCKVRSCCAEHRYLSCADCREHADPLGCGLFDNLFAKVIGVVLNSNRAACIAKVRELGPDGYAEFMAARRRQTLPRRGPRVE